MLEKPRERLRSRRPATYSATFRRRRAMASFLKRGKVWYVRYTDAAGMRRWKAGYTDKAMTKALADRTENEQRAIKRGEIDPQAEQRRKERTTLISDHLFDFRASMEANARSTNYIAYT